jgi:hypothetical protein
MPHVNYALRLRVYTLLLVGLFYCADPSQWWGIPIYYLVVVSQLSARTAEQIEVLRRTSSCRKKLMQKRNNSSVAIFLWPMLGVYLLMSYAFEDKKK